MTMGISLDTGSASQASTDMNGTSGASATPATSGPAGAMFGQLMARALQQHGQHKEADEASASCEEPALTRQDPDPDKTPTDAAGTDALRPGHSEDAVAQFNAMWMSNTSGTLTVPALPDVKSIALGPSIQAITASAAAPNASSLTAFAQQQGLDAAAIAWLMNPHAQAVGAGAAATHLPTAWTPPGIGTQPDALSGTGAGATFAPGLTAPAQIAAPGSTDTQAMTGALPGTATALAAAVPVVQAILSGPDSRTPAPKHAAGTNTPAPPEVTELSALTMAQLRWGGLKPRGAGQTDTTPSSAATSTATPALWAQSDLDLSDLDLSGLDLSSLDPGLLAQDGDTPAGQDAPAASEKAAADTPAIAGAALPGPARTESQSAMARGTAAGAHSAGNNASDQMQQLSEKMADAVGERILREIDRGQWNLRLMLKPAHLGHIEVEMRLRAGQLDAIFAAPQAATRELLQDGLSRLREHLNETGMDVASLQIKDGQNRQNGGDSTHGQQQTANTAKTPDQPETAAPSVQSPPRPRRADGWDVMV